MLVKLENEQLIWLPKTYEYNNITYSNYDMLDEDILLSHGWKLLVEEPMPDPQDGIGYESIYTEKDDSIVMSWKSYEIPPLPETNDRYSINQRNEFLEGIMEIVEYEQK